MHLCEKYFICVELFNSAIFNDLQVVVEITPKSKRETVFGLQYWDTLQPWF